MRLELTKAGDYAVRAMIALARNEGSRWLSAADIAASMQIPARFLPQVMAALARARLVDSRAGPGGAIRSGGRRRTSASCPSSRPSRAMAGESPA